MLQSCPDLQILFSTCKETCFFGKDPPKCHAVMNLIDFSVQIHNQNVCLNNHNKIFIFSGYHGSICIYILSIETFFYYNFSRLFDSYDSMFLLLPGFISQLNSQILQETSNSRFLQDLICSWTNNAIKMTCCQLKWLLTLALNAKTCNI